MSREQLLGSLLGAMRKQDTRALQRSLYRSLRRAAQPLDAIPASFRRNEAAGFPLPITLAPPPVAASPSLKAAASIGKSVLDPDTVQFLQQQQQQPVAQASPRPSPPPALVSALEGFLRVKCLRCKLYGLCMNKECLAAMLNGKMNLLFGFAAFERISAAFAAFGAFGIGSNEAGRR
eukprot:GABV01001755.1.p1 GENE.GABV01001755.1~~GABV01001755.1.p1  ORF type:complete len:177 (-),score=56.49 GABV01001755.1:197-727(-)